ncbi:hypothetical protein ACW4TU_38130 [Streptomyces sp. QTS52]
MCARPGIATLDGRATPFGLSAGRQPGVLLPLHVNVFVGGDPPRTVVTRYRRCVDLARLVDLVRALTASRSEGVAGLDPLTRLPGSGATTGWWTNGSRTGGRSRRAGWTSATSNG